MAEEKLLIKQEVCEYLRIAPATLDRLIKNKQISYIKIGRRVLFRKSDIDEFLEKHKISGK